MLINGVDNKIFDKLTNEYYYLYACLQPDDKVARWSKTTSISEDPKMIPVRTLDNLDPSEMYWYDRKNTILNDCDPIILKYNDWPIRIKAYHSTKMVNVGDEDVWLTDEIVNTRRILSELSARISTLESLK